MIIVSNVSIFASMPPFAMFIEQYHTVDERENEMVRSRDDDLQLGRHVTPALTAHVTTNTSPLRRCAR